VDNYCSSEKDEIRHEDLNRKIDSIVYCKRIDSLPSGRFAGNKGNAEFAGVDNAGVGNLNTYVRNSLCSLKQTFSPE